MRRTSSKGGVFLRMTLMCTLAVTVFAGFAHSAVISRAAWAPAQLLLYVAGTGWGNGAQVAITNPGTGGVLRTVQATRGGAWSAAVKIPANNVPCSVHAASGAVTADRAVTNAPVTCASSSDIRVLAFNNLGMHCYDRDFSVFSILPLFNTVNAQVIRAGSLTANPVILNNGQASVTYEGIMDRTASINTTSNNKTNFWKYVNGLFGVTLPVDQGLTGSKMPGTANVPQPFSVFDATIKWFTAEGIPITNYDDRLTRNPYPLMRIQPHDTAGSLLPAPVSVVLPVSDEMHCSDCHRNNGRAANLVTARKYKIKVWSRSTSPQIQYRQNILILHDAKKSTTLMSRTPVLCASCHYSPALDLAGTGPIGDQIGKPMLSYAVHGRHGKTVAGNIPSTGQPAIVADELATGCYRCHPGSVTKCLRGAMGAAGIGCKDCHGGMLAVGGAYSTRMPWLNEPKCQSCHTGDALSHFGATMRQRVAYDTMDPAATPAVSDKPEIRGGDG